jgi:glycosyltransferase involved in cell wall biosynthesis
MAKTFVSVLIDTFQHERFIEQAIVSVLEQDFPAAEREIIVVDDGSTDRTPDIVRKFEPQVRLLRKANGGQASAFNAGIPECKGEIVAFLDGDDWWAPGKLRAVCSALAENPDVGLVGHGITEVYGDGHEQTELLREALRRIGPVPEAIAIQADEYLFTLGAVLADVLILREPLTFYRLHDANAFQVGDGNAESLKRKYMVLATLAEKLRSKLKDVGVAERAARIVVDSVQTESDLIRLGMENGWPTETLRAELQSYHITHDDATALRWAFKCVTLLPACVLPSQVYYSLRRRISGSGFYRRARQKWLPNPEPAHVDRYRTTRP